MQGNDQSLDATLDKLRARCDRKVTLAEPCAPAEDAVSQCGYPAPPDFNTNSNLMSHIRHMGFTPCRMDPEFQVSIPPAWRPGYGEPLFLLMSKKHAMPALKAFTRAALNVRMEEIRGSDMTETEKCIELDSLVVTLGCEICLNEQGKLPVPKDLCESAGIAAGSEAILAGRGNYFEIWSKTNFDVVLAIETGWKGDEDLNIF